jgi:hypothetical protein
MTKDYIVKGHQYWVTVLPAIHQITKETVFIAYVSDEQPTGVFYGLPARDHFGKIMLFLDEISALMNAQTIKNSELK